MKFIYAILIMSILFVGCKTEVKEDPNAKVDAAFAKNSETALANIKGWQEENLDYSMYADDFVFLDAAFQAKNDSISKTEMMEMDKKMWTSFDFKILNEPVLLPGVNSETKKMDGSVRHYCQWEITRVATDSTEAKSATLKMYESFDFNEEGKIIAQQVYGDFSGIMGYLFGK